jgi:hypothetical protein
MGNCSAGTISAESQWHIRPTATTGEAMEEEGLLVLDKTGLEKEQRLLNRSSPRKPGWDKFDGENARLLQDG